MWAFEELDEDDPKFERRVCELLDTGWIPNLYNNTYYTEYSTTHFRKEVYVYED